MSQPVTCPECGEDVAYEPPHDAEPDVNSGEWGGGYRCECGWTRENRPGDPDDMRALAPAQEWRTP